MIGGSNLGRKNGGLGDTAPAIIPAGKTTKLDEGAKVCLQQDLNFPDRPETPSEIKKYRKSTVHEPGVIVKHPGTADDILPCQVNVPFGIQTAPKVEDALENVMRNYPSSELMQWRLERQEDVYASSKKEPLGKSALRGHQIPEHLGQQQPFGHFIDAKTLDAEPPSKTLLHPVDVAEEDPNGEHHDKYVRTHGDYAPGEQRRRNYEWENTGIDPATHQFGVVEKNPYRDGVAKVLNPTKDEDYQNISHIVPKRLEHFKLTDGDELGKPKHLGHGDRGLDREHTFGVPSRRYEEWGARRLMQGDYPEEAQQPDADLGKSIRKGFRNTTSDDKTFGIPTIRTDVPKRASHVACKDTTDNVKGLCDGNDYGEEPDAGTLLYPSAAAHRGVVEHHYLEPYTKEKLREFLTSAGVDLKNFDLYFQHAADVDKFGGGKCCIHTYRSIQHHFERPQ